MRPAASVAIWRPPIASADVASIAPLAQTASLVVPPPISMLSKRLDAASERATAPEPCAARRASMW